MHPTFLQARSRTLSILLCAAALGAIPLGCGAASEPKMAAPPADIPAAMADLARAEGEIARLFPEPFAQPAPPAAMAAPTPSQPGGAAQAAPPPPSTPMALDDAKPSYAGGAAEEATSATNDGPCTTACRALGSMERAASALCDLAGEGDARCGEARARLERAHTRVEASCPACRAAVVPG